MRHERDYSSTSSTSSSSTTASCFGFSSLRDMRSRVASESKRRSAADRQVGHGSCPSERWPGKQRLGQKRHLSRKSRCVPRDDLYGGSTCEQRFNLLTSRHEDDTSDADEPDDGFEYEYDSAQISGSYERAGENSHHSGNNCELEEGGESSPTSALPSHETTHLSSRRAASSAQSTIGCWTLASSEGFQEESQNVPSISLGYSAGVGNTERRSVSLATSSHMPRQLRRSFTDSPHVVWSVERNCYIHIFPRLSPRTMRGGPERGQPGPVTWTGLNQARDAPCDPRPWPLPPGLAPPLGLMSLQRSVTVPPSMMRPPGL